MQAGQCRYGAGTREILVYKLGVEAVCVRHTNRLLVHSCVIVQGAESSLEGHEERVRIDVFSHAGNESQLGAPMSHFSRIESH